MATCGLHATFHLIITHVVAAILLLQVSASGAAPTKVLVWGWNPIKNLSDPEVREIAEFAVKTHNDEAKTRLVLKQVVKGEMQVMEGMKYRLVVKVKDGATTKSFEAVIWDKAWKHFRHLLSFKAVSANV